MSDLTLTVPVTDIIRDALRQLDERCGLDRDEAYLLARIERGERVVLRPPNGADTCACKGYCIVEESDEPDEMQLCPHFR